MKFFKLRRVVVNFKANEAENTTECRIVYRLICNYGKESEIFKKEFKKILKRCTSLPGNNLEFTAVGIAKLSNEDTWDEAKGKEISRSKAELQGARVLAIMCLEFSKYLDKLSGAVYETERQCASVEHEKTQFLKETFGKELR